MTDSENSADDANQELNNMPIGLGPSSEDYYPTVVINSLMKILKDSSLSIHHTSVIQAVMYIFKTLGLKCVPFLPKVRKYLHCFRDVLNFFYIYIRLCLRLYQ